jgi:hypothetical protein
MKAATAAACQAANRALSQGSMALAERRGSAS